VPQTTLPLTYLEITPVAAQQKLKEDLKTTTFHFLFSLGSRVTKCKVEDWPSFAKIIPCLFQRPVGYVSVSITEARYASLVHLIARCLDEGLLT